MNDRLLLLVSLDVADVLLAPSQWTAFSGCFETLMNGVSYGLELDLKDDRSLKGCLKINTQVFDLKGWSMLKGLSLYGFLLEPQNSQPMALFKASMQSQYLILKVDFPSIEPNTKPSRCLILKRKKG